MFYLKKTESTTKIAGRELNVQNKNNFKKFSSVCT